MQTLDLGIINKPILVFGGAYSNLHALQVLQEYCFKLHYAADQIFCTGDCVAYCAYPEETINLIRDWGIYCIAGNVEIQLANEADDCGCNFNQDSVCDILAITWYEYINNRISPASRLWMKDLPQHITFKMNNNKFRIVHGSVAETAKFIFPGTPWNIKNNEIALSDTDAVIAGHSGIPFIQSHQYNTWMNAGAIGMPANDGTPDGWFLTLSPSGDHIICQTHRLAYNAKLAAQAIDDASLATEYARSLVTGIWPSQDILLEAERAQQGTPIQPVRVIL